MKASTQIACHRKTPADLLIACEPRVLIQLPPLVLLSPVPSVRGGYQEDTMTPRYEAADDHAE